MGETDELGIRYRGLVLGGRLKAKERREQEVVELMERGDEEEGGYESPGEYDAVLRWHCRVEGRAAVRP